MTSAGLDHAGAQMAEQAVSLFDMNSAQSGQGHLEAAHLFVPSSESFPLRSDLGLHRGWAYQQLIGVGIQERLGENWRMGAEMRLARLGWAGEDFLAVRPQEDYASAWSSHQIGGYFGHLRSRTLLGGGLSRTRQLQAPPGDPVRHDQPGTEWFGHGRWWVLHGYALGWDSLRTWSVGLDLEQRTIEGISEGGWGRFLPRLELIRRNDLREWEGRWEQDLWQQRLYVRSSWDGVERTPQWVALDFHLDPTRFMGLSVVRDLEREQWGSAFRVGIAEFGYSLAPDLLGQAGLEKSLWCRIGVSLVSWGSEIYSAPGAGRGVSGLGVDEVKKP